MIDECFDPNDNIGNLYCILLHSRLILSKDNHTFLKQKNITIYASSLQANDLYHNQNYTSPSAIIIGTEDKGISKEWSENSYKNIKIPMKGEIDSLNLSNAAAILIFEALRQRNFS